MSNVDSVDIHYTASPPSGTVYNIAAYQTGTSSHEPFPAIAYHMIVAEDGTYYLLHDLDRRVWHNGAAGRNEVAVGICYIGNTEPNNTQMKGLRQAIKWCEQQLGIKLSIRGHKDSYPTQCPGSTWNNWKNELG